MAVDCMTLYHAELTPVSLGVYCVVDLYPSSSCFVQCLSVDHVPMDG